MIRFSQGNIFNSQAEALVNPVNCVGVMGRGLALQFKERFPDNFTAYAAACKLGDVRPGHMFVFETSGLLQPRFIINFPTKRHWKDWSRLDDIRSGLSDLVPVIRSNRIRSVAIPPLGSGLGGHKWTTVRPLIVHALASLDGVDVEVFEPRIESSTLASDQLRQGGSARESEPQN